MDDFLQRLKQHKLVQWAIAYIAFAFALIQVLDAVADSYHWPHAVMHIAFGLLAVGLVVVLVLAWYHGEQGRQWASGPELLLIALALAIGGGLLWHFARAPTGTVAHAVASTHDAPSADGHPAASASASAPPVAAHPIPAKSVAVLPFENLSTDKANAYFADGMQDLILTKLADIGDLKVISRTSTMKYGSKPENLKRVGRELGVATILEGSVQKAGDQVLINVQLINATTDGHIWAKSYQRTLKNIFGVEGEVAEKVAKALNAKLSGSERKEIAHLPTTDPAAYTLYLKGVHEIREFFTGDGKTDRVKKAEAYLQQAVDKDPKFALAYALLARAQGDLQFNHIDDDPTLAKRELANARKAVKLQPGLAEAHDDLAVAYGANGMRDKSVAELKVALRLSPTDFRTRWHLATDLMARGQWSKASDLMAPVIRMDPGNVLTYLRVAEVDMDMRRYAHAKTTLAQGLAVAPDSVALIANQASLCLLLGKPDKALQWSAKLPASVNRHLLAFNARLLQHDFAKALAAAESIPASDDALAQAHRDFIVAAAERYTGDQARMQSALKNARKGIEAYLAHQPANATPNGSASIPAYRLLARVEALSGHRAAAVKALHAIAAHAGGYPFIRYAQAAVSAHFGDAGTAVEALGKLLHTQGAGWVTSAAGLRFDPLWDPIRKDPRFQAMLKQYAKVEAAAASTGDTTKATGTGGD